jgi:hypothetical protein
VKQRVQARGDRRPYQTVAIGLYADQTRALDDAIETLAERFLEEIDGLDHEQILEYLLRTHFKRPLAHAEPRATVSNRTAVLTQSFSRSQTANTPGRGKRKRKYA